MVVKNLTDEMYAGNKRVQRFTVTDEDSAGLKDLTGLTAKWALSLLDTAGNFLTTATLEKASPSNGIVLTDPTNGVLEVTLVEADTISLTPGDYYFELELFDATPEGVVVATGTLTIIANVVNTL